jgi:hypothetical protein
MANWIWFKDKVKDQEEKEEKVNLVVQVDKEEKDQTEF